MQGMPFPSLDSWHCGERLPSRREPDRDSDCQSQCNPEREGGAEERPQPQSSSTL